MKVVVVGASSGGIEALKALVAQLPADFDAPICVVLHSSPNAPGILGDILTKAGALEAANAVDREKLERGRIYVAPPDHHLVVADGHVRVTKGPRENRFRPAVDPLFRSAALAYGPATIAVVLTGNLDDGAAGVSAVKQLHGVAVVQDPHDALFPSMPMNAIQNGKVDHIVPIAAMGPLLVKLVAGVADLPAEAAMPAPVNVEVKIAMEVLQLKNGSRLRFRCHTGHAYSPASLLLPSTKVWKIRSGVRSGRWKKVTYYWIDSRNT